MSTGHTGAPLPPAPYSGELAVEYLLRAAPWFKRSRIKLGNGLRGRPTHDGFLISTASGAGKTIPTLSLKTMDHNAGTVTYTGGHFYSGSDAYGVDETVVAVSGGTEDDPVQVLLEYTHRSTAVIAPLAVMSVGDAPPPQSDGVSRFALGSFYVEDGRIKRPEVWEHHLGGDIRVGGVYGE